MKKIILFIILTCISFGEVFAAIETPSTQGTKFVFSFMMARPNKEKTLTLTVSSPSAGKIQFSGTGGVVGTEVINAGITVIDLAKVTKAGADNDLVDQGVVSGAYKNCYTNLPNQKLPQGYYVETFLADGITPLKVSLYAGLSSDASSDCANVYPIEALGNEYYVISRSGNTIGDRPSGTDSWDKHYNSEALIVGYADNTVIDIYPSCLIDDQALTDDIHPKITITLSKGESYLLRALSGDSTKKGADDLTGTRIVAADDGNMVGNKCKTFAVFAGTQHGSGVNYPFNNGDYEYDQMFPVHLWGTDYIVGATTLGDPRRSGTDVVRVVASQPCTEVEINGVYVTTLNQGDYYQHRDWLDKGTYVHTSKPVEVGLFTTGENVSSTAAGGPALIVLAPLQQYLRDITFAAYYSADVTEHSLMITSLSTIADQTTLNDGTSTTTLSPLNGYTWTPIESNPKYSQLVIPGISTSLSYTLSNVAPDDSIGGFTAIVYGSKGDNAGYGYSVGASASVVKTAFDLNGIGSGLLDQNVCVDKAVEFTPQFPPGLTIGFVEWDFDGDGAVDTITTSTNNYVASHSYDVSGVYNIRMIAHKDEVNCFSTSSSDTVDAVFRVKLYIYETTKNVSLCKGSDLTNAPLSAALSVLPLANVGYKWNTSAVDGSDSTITGATHTVLPIALDFGETKRFWRRSWDVNNSCDIYVDTFLVSVYDTIPNTVLVGSVCREMVLPQTPISHPLLVGTPNYVWYNAQGTVVGNSETYQVMDNHGTSTTYRRTASTGCMYVDYFDLSLKPITGDVYALDTICKGDLIVGQTSLVEGQTPTYQWLNSSMSAIPGATSADYAPTDDFGVTATYYQEATKGCMNRDTFSIYIPKKISNTLSASHPKVCGDGSTPVLITGTQEGDVTSTAWEYSEEGSAFQALNGVSGMSYGYSPTKSTVFRITSSGQCESSIVSSVEVIANPPFVATQLSAGEYISSDELSGNYVLPISGGQVEMSVETDVAGVYKYEWTLSDARSFDNISAYTESSSSLNGVLSSDVVVSVMVYDNDKLCSSKANDVTVSLLRIILHSVLLPSSTDIKNRTFAKYDDFGAPLSETMKDYKLTIFNRYGQPVFSATNDGWDGTVDGETADAGVYFYVLEYKKGSGTDQMKGSIEVIK